MSSYSAENLTKLLKLEKHVEGGAFRETYRSSMQMHPEGFEGPCNVSTGIYFMLEYGQFSAFHRIKSDEMWHHYLGESLAIYEIDSSGKLIRHSLGKNLEAGERLQLTIPAGSWFASRCEVQGAYALVGCTVAPGFDFRDFELADRAALTEAYPEHSELITEMTY